MNSYAIQSPLFYSCYTEDGTSFPETLNGFVVKEFMRNVFVVMDLSYSICLNGFVILMGLSYRIRSML